MGDKTGISWTDATWNPVRGCSRVSEGCTRCYAEQQAARIVRDAVPIKAGSGSKRKPGGVIELPYLDGMQHAASPEVAHYRLVLAEFGGRG